MKKALIIYHSEHHGNTEKIAKVIADVLKAKTIPSDKVEIKEFNKNYSDLFYISL